MTGGAALARLRHGIEARAGPNPGPLWGHVDRIDHRGISSWALDSANPGCPVLLEIDIGERVLGALTWPSFIAPT